MNHLSMPTDSTREPDARAHRDVAAATLVFSPAPVAPTHDEIAARAYSIYVRMGRRAGHCKQNWHQAEWALRVERQAAWVAMEAACAENPTTYFDSSTTLDVEADS